MPVDTARMTTAAKIGGGDARAFDLIDLGDRLFTQREPLNRLNQEIAENVYLERADFVSSNNNIIDFVGSLMDSTPAQLRQELGDAISAILRPRDKMWFASTSMIDKLDKVPQNAQYLEHITSVTKRAIYDPRSKFIRATKETDHGFVTFGQWVMSVEWIGDHLYYRSFHLRDCVWLENEIGDVDHLHRKDKMTARIMQRKFGDAALHQNVKNACEKEPHKEFNLRVVTMPTEEYDYICKRPVIRGVNRMPFVCIYIDADNLKILREDALPQFLYVVPRWHTLSGTQYAFSPAAMTSLPDARLTQDLARIILESGEKAVDPPALARYEAIRESNIQAGGITWADVQGDQKLSDAFQLLEFTGDMRTGFAMRADLREALANAWFKSKLQLPEPGKDMTAFEVAQRIEEHVRNLLPLFEPMEVEYNTKVLDLSFGHLMLMGRYGNPDDIPDQLSGQDISWSFKNPMQEASSRVLVQQFQEVLQIEQAAAEIGGVKVRRANLPVARDDALRGTSAPAEWLLTDEEMEAQAAEAEEAEASQALIAETSAVAAVAQQAGDAAQSLAAAGGPAPKQLPRPGSVLPTRPARRPA